MSIENLITNCLRGAVAIYGALVISFSLTNIASTQTQTWPQRTVRFILPFGPGSAADVAARVLGDELSSRWGKPVVVENRPGADGLLAINAIVGAKDDHMLLISSTGSFLAHPYVHKKLDYDFDRDLAPIGRIADTLLVVGVPESLKASNLSEFVALARSRPEINLAASPGLTEFAVDAFLKGEDLKTARVPYKDLGTAARDLSEGRIHFLLTSFAVVRPFVESGKVKVIASGTQQRSPITSAVPSIAESGYPMLATATSTAVFVSAEVPQSLRKKIADDIVAALKEPKLRDRIALTGQDVLPTGPDELSTILARQFKQAEAIASAAGIVKP